MPTHTPLRARAALAALALAVVPAGLHAQLATAAGSLGFIVPAARRTPMVVVPDVRGQTLPGAAARVTGVGLVPRRAVSNAGNVDTSPVRRQWPRAGQRVPQGTVVALELASASAADAIISHVADRPGSPLGEAAPQRFAHTAASAIADAPPPARHASVGWIGWLLAGAAVALLAHVISRVVVPARPVSRALPSDEAAASADPGPASAPGGAAGPSPVAVRVRKGRRATLFVIAPSAIGSVRGGDVLEA